MVYLLLALSLLCAPGGLVSLAVRLAPRAWNVHDETATGYDPRPQIPTARARKYGDELLALLATP